MTLHQKFLPLLFVLGCLAPYSFGHTAESDDLWTAKYDSHFKKYSKRYFGPFFDWRWFKSQAIVESGLKPQARSNRGAHGLMQILPSTFNEIRFARPHFADIRNPRWNIAAGIYYTRVLYDRWDHYPDEERLLFALASYNAGAKRVQQAVNKAPKNSKNWKTIRAFLPGETRRYVKRIQRIMGKK